MRFALFALFLLPLLAWAETPFDTYTNARFGFTLSYPASPKAGREPDNGSGREFKSADGAFTVAAFGRFLLKDQGDSLDKLYQDELTTLGPTLTYKRKSQSWYVVSGVTAEGLEYYRKQYVQGSNVHGFEITYPHARNKEFDPLVARIEKSFRPFLEGDFDRAP